AHYVAWRLMGGETEPLADRRRRRAEEKARATRQGQVAPVDFRNSDATVDDQKALEGLTPDDRQAALEEQDEQHYYDPDSRGSAGTLY
ncbi:MAG: hypothetical protein ACREKB_13795, partial [Candidatus Rokuibacteriota bacterium]